MQLAIGTKKVMFEAMSRHTFLIYTTADAVPADKNREGYLVEYLDGGPSNHPDHEHYISWSPKTVFDAAYQATDKGMSFGHALVCLESGCQVSMSPDDWYMFTKLDNGTKHIMRYDIQMDVSEYITAFPYRQVVSKDWVVVE